jgi:hypothetical protein
MVVTAGIVKAAIGALLVLLIFLAVVKLTDRLPW